MPGRALRRLQGALDNEVHQATLKILDDGLAPPDVNSVYQAIQRSNSSLKRKPKKVLQSSLERVLGFMDDEGLSEDSEAAVDEKQSRVSGDDSNIMNRSLRASLLPATAPPSPPIMVEDAQPRKRKVTGESLAKRQKTSIDTTPPSHMSLADIGGVDHVITQLNELLTLPLLRPEKYAEMKVSIPRGVLLHGPPGCGKTMISRAFAAELGLPFVEILGPSIVSGMSGESEKQVRDRFEEAKRQAPCLMFIDEIDVIAPKRDTSQSQMEKRIVAQLLLSMDGLAMDRNDSKPVIVLAATNRPDSIDPALRRGGRFDTEINLGVPSEGIRELILRAQTREANLSGHVDFKRLAKMTPGFVGADLRDLVSKAGSWQMSQYRRALQRQAQALEGDMDVDGMPDISEAVLNTRRLMKIAKRTDLPEPAGFETAISMEAFLAVLPAITPSGKREGFATIPDITWEDIGALKEVRDELQIAIVEPIKNPERYAKVGISAPTGVLLWGPPGCGKTLLAKAAAAESKANFISVKGPELLDKFVGESERAVRQVFSRARSSVPCVIFFDELDALVPRRDPSSSSEASARVVNTLLTELDGLSTRAGIYVIAATNRPEIIDEAMLRPGRLETPLFVNLPGPEERVEILRALIRNKPYPPEVAEIARKCDGYSGADLGSLLRQAGHNALRRESEVVELQDFEVATTRVKGSVASMARYYKLKERFSQRF